MERDDSVGYRWDRDSDSVTAPVPARFPSREIRDDINLGKSLE
jgi:hypothetical protein